MTICSATQPRVRRPSKAWGEWKRGKEEFGSISNPVKFFSLLSVEVNSLVVRVNSPWRSATSLSFEVEVLLSDQPAHNPTTPRPSPPMDKSSLTKVRRKRKRKLQGRVEQLFLYCSLFLPVARSTWSSLPRRREVQGSRCWQWQDFELLTKKENPAGRGWYLQDCKAHK